MVGTKLLYDKKVGKILKERKMVEREREREDDSFKSS